MGPSPIQISEMQAYLALFPHDEPGFFVRAIQALDREWLTDAAVKSEAKMKKSSGKASRKPRRR